MKDRSGRAPARLMTGLVLLLALAGLPGAHAQGFGGGGARGGPAEVGVMALTRAQVPVTVELPGRAVAFQRAAIRPRVGGEITAIAYEAGSEVTAGTVLFQLEDETLAAELTAREVAVTSAEAALGGVRATAERYRRLSSSGSGVSLADLEAAEVALSVAEATLGAAEAQRDLARMALARTEITSPINGLVAVTPFSVGDIVSAGQNEALTEVAQIDPIYVDVSESRARILRHQQSINEGLMQRPENPGGAQLTLETGEAYPATGRVLSPGAAVSATTGTIPIRLQFPNPDRQILPGQFVRVTLTIGQINAFLVPQRATSRAAGGQLTAFVMREGRAVQVQLTENGTHQNAWIVTEGVAEGDLLVLDGLSGLRDGAEVTGTPVSIDENGVVRDAPPENGGASVVPASSDRPANASGAPPATPTTGTNVTDGAAATTSNAPTENAGQTTPSDAPAAGTNATAEAPPPRRPATTAAGATPTGGDGG
ncbi:MAG: efflux RND transporter periplasmic adaptor subunit [Paracoccus sp. (in: a-proteobacteria)]|nr:efflux RND transporter periplasmic adaptor subunit [Paracoccus sp. (in: a-proteobacteria)]